MPVSPFKEKFQRNAEALIDDHAGLLRNDTRPVLGQPRPVPSFAAEGRPVIPPTRQSGDAVG